MAIMKSVQIMSESSKSFEDAIETAVSRMSNSVNHVRSANVNNQSVVVKSGKITKYRVNLQITFEVKK
ncbi:MAG: dodecin family protein [Robiginitomaculum sp.]